MSNKKVLFLDSHIVIIIGGSKSWAFVFVCLFEQTKENKTTFGHWDASGVTVFTGKKNKSKRITSYLAGFSWEMLANWLDKTRLMIVTIFIMCFLFFFSLDSFLFFATRNLTYCLKRKHLFRLQPLLCSFGLTPKYVNGRVLLNQK